MTTPWWAIALLAVTLGGCNVTPANDFGTSVHRSTPINDSMPITDRGDDPSTSPSASGDRAATPPQTTRLSENMPAPVSITEAGQMGRIDAPELHEISGMASSALYPGLLYAINDGGNAPALFAIDETGTLLARWRINARNRDWEDMTPIRLGNSDYLVIGDTGDNLRIHDKAQLYFLQEPQFPAASDNLDPAFTISYRYEDGPRNIEAFAAIGNTLYMLSKEPPDTAGLTPHRIYQLELPEDLNRIQDSPELTATFMGTMPSRAIGFEAILAAALAGVDLTHPTAMAFDPSDNALYILNYREVLRVRRQGSQSWSEALMQPIEKMMSHALVQAEALCVSPGRAIWFTSERLGAPLWAIPVIPPL